MTNASRTPLAIAGTWLAITLSWWGLAFLPMPNASPDWLVAARDVCFGTMENGLPNPAGWMVLTLGPLSFLLALLAIWPRDLWQALQKMGRSGRGQVALFLALLAVLMEAGWVARKVAVGLSSSRLDFSRPGNESLPGNYPRTSIAVPDFALTDQFGNELKFSALRGETFILTFAFAHCQSVCPVLVKESLRALKDTATRRSHLLIVTLDPWRDTPKALPYLAQKWELPASARVLSGPVKNVVAVLEHFKIPYKRDSKTGDVEHPALTFVISPDGKIAYTFNNAPAAWLTQAVDRIENEKDIAAARQDL